jgi:hypothetical protein
MNIQASGLHADHANLQSTSSVCLSLYLTDPTACHTISAYPEGVARANALVSFTRMLIFDLPPLKNQNFEKLTMTLLRAATGLPLFVAGRNL